MLFYETIFVSTPIGSLYDRIEDQKHTNKSSTVQLNAKRSKVHPIFHINSQTFYTLLYILQTLLFSVIINCNMHYFMFRRTRVSVGWEKICSPTLFIMLKGSRNNTIRTGGISEVFCCIFLYWTIGKKQIQVRITKLLCYFLTISWNAFCMFFLNLYWNNSYF